MSSVSVVTVLGAGSWGSALAIQLARNGVATRLWGRDAEQMERMERERCNSVYLPDVRFPDRLSATADLKLAIDSGSAILVAVPSQAFRATLRQVAPMLKDGAPLAWATKGLEPGTAKLLHQVVADELGSAYPTAVISGPTFAAEVARGLPTAVTVASANPDVAQFFAGCLHGAAFRAYTCGDVIGVELGGAIKNVLAIAAGIADGLGFGSNTRAALITRGLAEMIRLGNAYGAQPETFMGLAGLGDLILTCTDDQSRNRRVGLSLGRGLPLDETLRTIGQAVEGVKSAPEIVRAAREHNVEMPIIEQVYRVLYEHRSPHDAVAALLAREPKAESPSL